MEAHSIKKTNRVFYPRNFNLSPAFLKALKHEYDRQKSKGIDGNKFIQKVSKALQFHVNDIENGRALISDEENGSGNQSSVSSRS